MWKAQQNLPPKNLTNKFNNKISKQSFHQDDLNHYI